MKPGIKYPWNTKETRIVDVVTPHDRAIRSSRRSGFSRGIRILGMEGAAVNTLTEIDDP